MTPSTAPQRSLLTKLYALLTPRERRQMLLLLPAVALTALLEAAGVISIIPFLGMLADPAAIERSGALRSLSDALGAPSRERLFFTVGVGVLALLTLGNGVSALTTWGLLRFSWARNHSLSLRLLSDYLEQPFEFHLTRNSADFAAKILGEVSHVVQGVLLQVLQLFARGVVMACILTVLIWVDPPLALGVTVAFGGVYGALYWLVHRRIAVSGRIRTSANAQRHRIAADAAAGIKELKLYGLERHVLARYGVASSDFSRAHANMSIISQLPRYALETIAFGGVLVVVLILLLRGRPFHDALPMLGLYSLAAARLLPGLQTVFSGFAALQFSQGALDGLLADLARPGPTQESAAPPATVSGGIAALGVSYRYPAAPAPALSNIDLRVDAGEWIAFVGTTGSGKSTLADLLLGLHDPTSGEVRVGEQPLRDPGVRRAWQAKVGYVPQHLFLLDDTITRNVCLGVPDEAIDSSRLRWAVQVAQLDRLVSALPEGLETFLGERGLRLSGGERQRVGIARALYRRPEFLVLDEATSALDTVTETALFTALRAELTGCAVISIAHRLSTTRTFDRIYVLACGAVTEVGTYAELVERSPTFAALLGRPEPASTSDRLTSTSSTSSPTSP